MMLAGVVRSVNQRRGFLAVEVDANDYTIVEVLDDLGQFEVGDVVSGALDAHEGQRLQNNTKGFQFDAYIQAVGATSANAAQLMR